MNEFAEMNLSQEQEHAVEIMLSGRNVFLTGKAGTGKSTVIEAFKQRCNRQLVCLAPTGIAALNIGGSTIHQFFGLPPIINEYTCQNSASQKHLLFARVDTLLIDEISMVRSDVFAAMDTILRMAATGTNRFLPFGGKQIIAIGDFSQTASSR